VVNATTSGKIAEVYVKQGDTVSAGQKLVRLDGTSAQQDVNTAWANLKSARAKLQDVISKSSTATADIELQNAAVTKANADYSKADEARSALTINSPIGGTVIAVSANVGEQAGGSSGSGSSGGGSSSSSGSSSGSSGLVTVADLTRLSMKASVDQADISKVNLDQQAKITLDALPGKDFTGKVTSIDPVPTTDQNVVTYSVNISLDQLDPGVRLGMSANISIDLGKKDGVLVVPNIAIHSQGADKTVNKMVDGQSTAVTVETGAADSQNTEITSGLSVGDKIVLQSFQSTTGQSPTTGGTGGSFGGGFGGGGRSGGGLGGPGGN
jgi:macrolide-specific efflux system membrane fusion protein